MDNPSREPTLPAKRVNAVLEHLAEAAPQDHVAPLVDRSPVHVLYGGAHLFKRDTPDKLARMARSAFDEHAETSDIFASAEVRDRVREKLQREPIEAMCIDFEDGFGPRPDGEEDAEAVRAATELAAMAEGTLVGVRIKPLTGSTARRAARTLDLFVSTLMDAGPLRPGFTVTLPKVTRAAEVVALGELLAMLETAKKIPRGRVRVELMIEAPRALFDESGRLAIASLVDAAGGRCVAVHLGAYDLTASLGVNATEQRLDHPACDLARIAMAIALAGRSVAIYDGATTSIPVGDGDAVRRAWTAHAINVRRAIDFGIFQGWDLHPAQLPARYGALFGYFLKRRADLATRLATFVERATQATRIGQTFDDAATAQGLLNFFLRGVSCGALTEEDVTATTLTTKELQTRSFASIVAAWSGRA